jgi:hypothetical protein
MTDLQKLKALAEAAPVGPWYPPDEGSHSGMVFDCDLGSLLSYESIDTERDACVKYVAATNPAAVLELIAEIERLTADNRSKNGSLASYGKQISALQRAVKNRDKVLAKVSAERDQLKADNEALRKDAERYRFVRNPIARGSSLAIWHEGRMPMFSGIADVAIDSDMSKEAQS